MEYSLQYGTTVIDYSIKRTNRKTLAVEVHPDLSVKVIAPVNASQEDIEARLLKRGSWILKQLSWFETFLPHFPAREYVSGETHLYLGRKYLLKVKNSPFNSVKLKGGILEVNSKTGINETAKTKCLLAGWYARHTNEKFSELFIRSFNNFNSYNLQKPELIILRMKNRWGSYTSKGKIILNPELIQTPLKCIEYVIYHELCHLIYPNHGTGFYELLEKHLPDWKVRKQRLEKTIQL